RAGVVQEAAGVVVVDGVGDHALGGGDDVPVGQGDAQPRGGSRRRNDLHAIDGDGVVGSVVEDAERVPPGPQARDAVAQHVAGASVVGRTVRWRAHDG